MRRRSDMPFWKPPELPPVQQLPPPRKATGPSVAARVLAGLAAVALGVGALLGLRGTFAAGGRGFGSLGGLALLIPTVILLRFAVKGVKKPV